jgi:hypothetical protein
MAIKRPDTPLAETPKPDYRNINKKTKIRSVSKSYVPTAKDSSDYEKGFNEAIEGKNKLFPSRAKVQGRFEAKQRGLTPKR